MRIIVSVVLLLLIAAVIGNQPAQSSYNEDNTIILKAAGPTIAPNTANVPVPGVVFTYEANSTYLIIGSAVINNAANTTGVGFNLDVTTTVTSVNLSFTHQLANTGTLTGGSCIADAVSVGVSSGIPTNATNVPVDLNGLLVTGATSGSCLLNFRSEVAAVAQCTSCALQIRKL